MLKKVVVTGLGVVSPCGNNVETFWNNISNGKSGLGLVTQFDTSDFEVKIGGEVKDFDPADHMDKKESRRMDRFTHFAISAANEAIADAGLDLEKLDRERIGVVVGSGIGGLSTHEKQHDVLKEKGPRKISPFYVVMMITDIAPGYISIMHGLKGPNYSVVSACATASHAIGDAMMLIQRGDADIMVCGGAEAALRPMALGGFASMKALSTNNEDPQGASRPFDLNRDGFVMGEGAGIAVIESEESAIKRGARIYAELGGFGFTGDAHHVTAPAPGHEGAVRAMKIALKSAGLKPEDIDYVNAHGTSTPFNDKHESAAMKTIFGERAKSDLNISSTKSMTGHLLGAAGGVELSAAVKALQTGVVPPTLNYNTKDPDCDLNYTPNVKVEKEVNAAMSNTFGFGGHNASLVIKKYAQ